MLVNHALVRSFINVISELLRLEMYLRRKNHLPVGPEGCCAVHMQLLSLHDTLTLQHNIEIIEIAHTQHLMENLALLNKRTTL